MSGEKPTPPVAEELSAPDLTLEQGAEVLAENPKELDAFNTEVITTIF